MCQVLLLANYLIFESWVKGVTRRKGSLDGEGPCSDLEWWAPALAVFRGIFRWKTSGPRSIIGVSRQRLQQLCKHSVLSIVIQHEALTTVVSCPRAGKFTLWFHLTIQTRVSSGNQRILTKKKKKTWQFVVARKVKLWCSSWITLMPFTRKVRLSRMDQTLKRPGNVEVRFSGGLAGKTDRCRVAVPPVPCVLP